MASMYRRLMDTRTLASSEKQPLTDALDAGAYNKLQLQVRVPKQGTAGNLLIKHAAVLEDEAFIIAASVALNATSNALVTVTDFLRFVRWETDANVAGAPIALIDAVAKE